MTIADMITLSRLILRLGQVYRATRDADGRPESDTTHTLMLAMLAGEVAEAEGCDRAAVVAMALIHDIAEAYAGDTSTLRALSAKDARAKAEREAAAMNRVRADLGGFPWLLSLIERYEAQDCRESRMVRIMDKVTPKLTHSGNGCVVPMEQEMSLAEFRRQHADQIRKLSDRGHDLPVTMGLLCDACREAEAAWPVEET